MQREPAQQDHQGHGVPELLGGGQGRGPLQHAGLGGPAHRAQEQHGQGEEDGNAYGTWEITDTEMGGNFKQAN